MIDKYILSYKYFIYPLVLIIRNKLNFALDGLEVRKICVQREIKVDGKVRTDPKFPAGFMDVVQIPKAQKAFRILYDIKGRFTCHPIDAEKVKFKLKKISQLTTNN